MTELSLPMRPGTLALVLAGVFLGGALDHFILALARSRRTPYGVRSGRYGNWLLGFLDLVLAGAILRFGRPRPLP